MNMDFSLSGLSPILPTDLSAGTTAPGVPQATRIHQVAKAMEGMFVGQLMSELGKGAETDSDSDDSSNYQDFIQQAMTQVATSKGGFGLAKMIEASLTHNQQKTSVDGKDNHVHAN